MKRGEGKQGFPSVLAPSTQQEKVLEQQHCPTAPSALLERNLYIYAAQYGGHQACAATECLSSGYIEPNV